MTLFTKHYRYVTDAGDEPLSLHELTTRVRDALGPLVDGVYDLSRADAAFSDATLVRVLSYENMLFNGEPFPYLPEYARDAVPENPNPWQHVFAIVRRDETRELSADDYIGLYTGINRLLQPFDTQHANATGNIKRRIAERVWEKLDAITQDIAVRIPRNIDLAPAHFSFRKQKNAQTRPWRSVFYKNKKVGVYYIETDVEPGKEPDEVCFLFGGSDEHLYVHVPDTSDDTIARALVKCLEDTPTSGWVNAYDRIVREVSPWRR